MSTNRLESVSVSPSGTIGHREERMERALDALRGTSDETPYQVSLELLAELRALFAPGGLRPTVQLEEDGRKKRATAVESSWSFQSGEIVIFYDTSTGLELVPTAGQVLPIPAQNLSTNFIDDEVRQCCEALAEAEKSGKHFVAYKWFRDLALAELRDAWAATAEGRARVLKEAIDRGAIETRKIPNPKSPAYPTTTVRLAPKASTRVPIKSRFNPVPIKGEPASVTLLRDRGSY